MTDPSGTTPPPGWYYASGDPIGTQRYWDGRQWIGDPQWAAQPPVGYPPAGAIAGIGRTLADPGRRIVARILDFVICVAVAVVVVLIALAVAWDGDSFDEDDYVNLTLPLTLAIAAYEVVLTAWRGATLGKMAMGIEVVKQDGTSPPGLATSALRYVLGLVGLVPGLGAFASLVLTIISFVFLFTDPRRRTLNDRIASTYVVNRRDRNDPGWV